MPDEDRRGDSPGGGQTIHAFGLVEYTRSERKPSVFPEVPDFESDEEMDAYFASEYEPFSPSDHRIEFSDVLHDVLWGRRGCLFCASQMSRAERLIHVTPTVLVGLLDLGFSFKDFIGLVPGASWYMRRRQRLERERITNAQLAIPLDDGWVAVREHAPALSYERFHRALCPTCNWWVVGFEDSQFSPFYGDIDRWQLAYGVATVYDPLSVDTPVSAARDFLARHPDNLARFDPFRFEDLMVSCLRDYFGDGDVVKVGGRKDRGIDIVAYRATGETVLIQVKRRADFSKRETVVPVRALHGVMFREGVSHGMVITTASAFTQDAHQEVSAAAERLEHYSMELLTEPDVVDLLRLRTESSQTMLDEVGLDFSRRPQWLCRPQWIDATALQG
jgi:hypothetical protein